MRLKFFPLRCRNAWIAKEQRYVKFATVHSDEHLHKNSNLRNHHAAKKN